MKIRKIMIGLTTVTILGGTITSLVSCNSKQEKPSYNIWDLSTYSNKQKNYITDGFKTELKKVLYSNWYESYNGRNDHSLISNKMFLNFINGFYLTETSSNIFNVSNFIDAGFSKVNRLSASDYDYIILNNNGTVVNYYANIINTLKNGIYIDIKARSVRSVTNKIKEENPYTGSVNIWVKIN